MCHLNSLSLIQRGLIYISHPRGWVYNQKMGWFFLSKREVRKGFRKVSKSIEELKKDIVSKDTIKLLIENAILKERSENSMNSTPSHHALPEVSPQTPLRKKAERMIDKAEIMQEVRVMELEGLSTSYMLNEITQIKKLCKKSCFFKYLREVRKHIARTPQTILTDKAL